MVLREYLIGTGGWAYFSVPGIHPLSAYARAFSFVEVNSTFYQIPSMREVENWRKIVPPDFRFAVRANRAITHEYKLQPQPIMYDTFEKMKRICEILRADFLHLLTPPSKWDSSSTKNLQDYLSGLELGRLRLALEMRGTDSSKLPAKLLKTMQDHDVIHCVDLSKGETPAFKSDVLYTRLFGKGSHNVYQPTDVELQEIDSRASKGSSERVVMSFHFVRMYKDAARLKIYKDTGKFPMVTHSTGPESLEEVLTQDAKFPSTKQDLIRDQGWKLFDLSKSERARAEEFLQKLPDRTYSNISEVTNELKPIVK